jgi:hypothetical protein
VLIYIHLESKDEWDYAIDMPMPPRIGEGVLIFAGGATSKGIGRVEDVFYTLHGCHSLEEARENVSRIENPECHVLIRKTPPPDWFIKRM